MKTAQSLVSVSGRKSTTDATKRGTDLARIKWQLPSEKNSRKLLGNIWIEEVDRHAAAGREVDEIAAECGVLLVCLHLCCHNL